MTAPHVTATWLLEGRDVDQWTGVAGPVEWSCTLAEFVESNAEDAETIAAVLALDVGDAVEIGGGAAVLTSVRRVR